MSNRFIPVFVLLCIRQLLIHIPPQAPLVSNRKTYIHRELLQLVGPRSLCEDVDCLHIRAKVYVGLHLWPGLSLGLSDNAH